MCFSLFQRWISKENCIINQNVFILQYGRQHIEVAKKLKRVDSFEEESEKEVSKTDGMLSLTYHDILSLAYIIACAHILSHLNLMSYLVNHSNIGGVVIQRETVLVPERTHTNCNGSSNNGKSEFSISPTEVLNISHRSMFQKVSFFHCTNIFSERKLCCYV